MFNMPAKYVFWLFTADTCLNAVVIANDKDEARQRAFTESRDEQWRTANVAILAECRHTRTSRVVALEKP
jgi:hypothetical protein